MLSKYFVEKELDAPVVVSPDIGSTKRARDFAHLLDAPLAIVEKRRTGNDDNVETHNVIGEVNNRNAILIDDEIATGGTMLAAAEGLRMNGAREVYVAAAHGVFPNGAAHRLAERPEISEIVITDTVPLPPEKQHNKIRVLSIAPLIGEAIDRIHKGRSVGALFPD